MTGAISSSLSVNATARDILRAAYGACPYTQAQLAARAGVSENTVYRVLSGKNTRAESLICIALALGLEVQFTKRTFTATHTAA